MTSSSIIQHYDLFHHDVPFPANPSHGTLFYRVCTLSFHPKLPEHKSSDLTPRGGPAKGIPLERRGNPSMHGEIHLDHTQCLQVVYFTSKEMSQWWWLWPQNTATRRSLWSSSAATLKSSISTTFLHCRKWQTTKNKTESGHKTVAKKVLGLFQNNKEH